MHLQTTSVLRAASLVSLLFFFALLGEPARASDPWEVRVNDAIGVPGRGLDFLNAGRLVARLVHGPGQMKPFLHVYGRDGTLLTNGGVDAAGQPLGLNYNHRGIFIGWNKVTSDLGVFDLWHMNTYGRTGGIMEVSSIATLRGGGRGEADVVVDWRAERSDGSHRSDLILRERRRTLVSEPAAGMTQVDAHFDLTAERDVALNGDLQHAGVHFRATHEMVPRKAEVRFLWEPDLPPGKGRVISPEFKWCLMRFPVGERWYAALQINGPETPVAELSWRDYGRFGFFFSRSIPRGETLYLRYRFVVRETAVPAADGADAAELRAWAAREYRRYLQETKS